MEMDELQNAFVEQFPYELEGKSLVYFFRRFAAQHDKNFINYKEVRRLLADKLLTHRNRGKS